MKWSTVMRKKHRNLAIQFYQYIYEQCEEFGSVGSATFWLFRSGSAKYKDPRIRIKGPKYPTKAAKKRWLSKLKFELFKKCPYI